ncbi:MAG: anti-sigma factor [Chitinophagaceae bacterium]|nr:MAG: anti-sigma factor [Chitinophagaceae bacterium]
MLELHALGLTSDQEAALVAGWAAQYPEVRAELDNIESTLELYAHEHAIQPSGATRLTIMDTLKERLMQDKQPAIVRGISPAWKYAAAAAILLLLASVFFNFSTYNKLKQSELALTESRRELLAANEQMETINNDMQVVKNKYSRTVALDGLEAAPEAAAKIFWMKNTGEVFIDPSNLPAPPEGKQYQLWAIVDGKPVDGGMIMPAKDNKAYHIQKMKSFGKAEAFAVTLESAGGNPTPKGDMYVMGKL